jgi:hypothetical protein
MNLRMSDNIRSMLFNLSRALISTTVEKEDRVKPYKVSLAYTHAPRTVSVPFPVVLTSFGSALPLSFADQLVID